MNPAALPPSVVLAVVFVLGTMLGSLANWAIYRLAWNVREISPWGPVPIGAKPRTALDRVPVIGWLGMAREAEHHGRGFWVRPMLLELLLGAGLAALCWWEVYQRGLVVPQINELLAIANLPVQINPAIVPLSAVSWTFVGHMLLITLLLAASFIDIDEKIVPDEITVPGTVLGLILATCVPQSLLPIVVEQQSALSTPVPLNQVAPGAIVYVEVGSSRVDLQACKLEYSIVSPK